MNTTAHRRLAGTPFFSFGLSSLTSDVTPKWHLTQGSASQVATADVAHLSHTPAASHGQAHWQVQTGGVHSTPAVVDGVVYVSSLDGIVQALDADTGTERWRFEAGGPTTSPAVFDDIVFVSGGGRLYALDAEDGTEAWSATTDGDSLFSDAIVDDRTLYVGGHDGYLYAINPSTGDIFWHFRTDDRIWTAPTVAGDLVFARSDDGNLYAVDTATGEEHWRHQIGWAYEASAAVVADGIVYAGGSCGAIYALDADTGDLCWDVLIPGVVNSTPVVTNGRLFIATELPQRLGAIIALDAATGSQDWQLDVDAGIASPLGLTGETVYIGDAAGTVHGFDGVSGNLAWSFLLDDRHAASAPSVVDDVLYLGTTDGTPRSPLPRLEERRTAGSCPHRRRMNPN